MSQPSGMKSVSDGFFANSFGLAPFCALAIVLNGSLALKILADES